ncbi:hypothetical protein Dda_1612 [Drechslerella dactyloides]|uniref:Uncharacterized protein n=1 Tax=Drechslerella dactyloides TaxID=74499 RepID=A0AAD6J210_DREDA|nr:hypothetical protein Dda_1612 [Drechslerella dactyloides]
MSFTEPIMDSKSEDILESPDDAYKKPTIVLGLPNEALRFEKVEYKYLTKDDEKDLEDVPYLVLREREFRALEKSLPRVPGQHQAIRELVIDKRLTDTFEPPIKIPWPTSRRSWRKHWKLYLVCVFVLLIYTVLPPVLLLTRGRDQTKASLTDGELQTATAYVKGKWLFEVSAEEAAKITYDFHHDV